MSLLFVVFAVKINKIRVRVLIGYQRVTWQRGKRPAVCHVRQLSYCITALCTLRTLISFPLWALHPLNVRPFRCLSFCSFPRALSLLRPRTFLLVYSKIKPKTPLHVASTIQPTSQLASLKYQNGNPTVVFCVTNEGN